MRIWGADFGFAAVQAVTKDKKPVTVPFLRGTEYRTDVPTSRHRPALP
ncbi:hypothetical protein [Bradyrhizobium sp. Arg816]|nr:hypothetical protein [Bradyrhizobium sp. Arg816]MDI3561466.1 hypothetical protein [Bradyrhizobium sp. Arg816]